MPRIWLCFCASIFLLPAALQAKVNPAKGTNQPGCPQQTPQQCLAQALDAMGGRDHLQQIKTLRLKTIGHTLLMEQSYRQSPFITSYDRTQTTYDLANQRVLIEAKITWPESDPNQSDLDNTVVIGPEGGVTRGKDADAPTSLGSIASARQSLALGPARLLLTALDSPDLHYDSPATLRSTSHAVVAFTWQKIPVRILLNSFNHLPDAVETMQQFNDFWYFWGDVQQRIYFDNWKRTQGISYPTNLVEERNGTIWKSTQALDVEFNVATDDKTFAMDAKIAARSAASHGWNRPFPAAKPTELAPGIDLFEGAWNSTIIKQSDGIVILEAPISGLYMQGVIEEARKRYPGAPIQAVLSTSDSWPHTGGIRYVVSQGLPVYILDLNQPLLDRIIQAPHTLDPDALASSKNPRPNWKIVSGKQALGSGENRIELYPLRGASTERQYMAYFPDSHILYASDTLVLNDDGNLYDPELMYEVLQAVLREHLTVKTVFAMHQGPTPWEQVRALVEKS